MINSNSCCFTFLSDTQPQLQVQILLELSEKEKNLVLKREVTIQSAGKLTEDLTVSISIWPNVSNENFLPCYDGTGGKLSPGPAAAYRFAGRTAPDGIRLGLPMVTSIGDTPKERITIVADPYFSTLFTNNTVNGNIPGRSVLRTVLKKRTDPDHFSQWYP